MFLRICALFALAGALLFCTAAPINSHLSPNQKFIVSHYLKMVEKCYYNRTWMNYKVGLHRVGLHKVTSLHNKTLCHLITNVTELANTDDSVWVQLSDMFNHYEASDALMDPVRVINCFLDKRAYSTSNISICATQVSDWVHNTFGDVVSMRETKAVEYLSKLRQAMDEVDYCLDIVDKPWMPFPDSCTFLDEQDLLDHCFYYHQFNQWEPCQKILPIVSYPYTSIAEDARGLYLYSSWRNMSKHMDVETIEEFRMGMEGESFPMYHVHECRHFRDWLGDPKHKCHNITTHTRLSAQHVKYSNEMRHLQILYNQQSWELWKLDCARNHKDSSEQFYPDTCGKLKSGYYGKNWTVLRNPNPWKP